MTQAHRQSGCGLVVEDDELLAMMMAQVLTDIGYDDVRTCASTGEAMAMMAELRPSILTLDVSLADRDDGWALAELAHQVSETPPVIIFATGSPEAVPERIARLGHVLKKPVEPEQVHAAILKVRQERGLLGRMRRILG